MILKASSKINCVLHHPCFRPTDFFAEPSLADAVWKFAQDTDMSAQKDEDGMCYVVDGGSLLHHLPWSRNVTFGTICQRCVDYVHEKYRDPTVVCDGYEASPSTKDITHKRRSGGMIGAQDNFVEGMYVKTKKEMFVTNTTNKQRFIRMLSENYRRKASKRFMQLVTQLY